MHRDEGQIGSDGEVASRGIPTEIVGNSIYHILIRIKLIASFRDNFSKSIPHGPVELPTGFVENPIDWKLVGSILRSDIYRKTVFYFLDYGAATHLILQIRLGFKDGPISRVLKHLVRCGVITPALKLPKKIKSKGGPRPTLYVIQDATIDQINEAQVLHRRLSSPKYRVAEDMAQLLLEEYIEPKRLKEISYREIITRVKERHIHFVAPDIADLAAQYLQEMGITVWR